MQDPVNEEIKRNLLTESRGKAYVALKAFCNEASNHEPCLNFTKCDECSVQRRIEELRDEVMWHP